MLLSFLWLFCALFKTAFVLLIKKINPLPSEGAVQTSGLVRWMEHNWAGLTLGLTLRHALHLFARSFAELTQRQKVGHYLCILLSVDCEILRFFLVFLFFQGWRGGGGRAHSTWKLIISDPCCVQGREAGPQGWGERVRGWREGWPQRRAGSDEGREGRGWACKSASAED